MPKLAFRRIIILILYKICIEYNKFKPLGEISIDDFSVKNYFYMIKYSKSLK